MGAGSNAWERGVQREMAKLRHPCRPARLLLAGMLLAGMLLAGMLLAGCAGSKEAVRGEGEAARPERKARPFRSGERLVYRARVSGVDAARATLSVGTPGTRDGRPVLPLRVTVEGYGWLTRFYPLKIKLITEADPDTLRPLRMKRNGANGSLERTVEMIFRGGERVDVTMAIAGDRPRRYRRKSLPGAYDAVSGLYDIRAWLLSGEAKRELAVFDGVWNRTVRVVKGPIEEVWTPAGWFSARRFEVEAERVQVKGDAGQPRWQPRTERFTAWVTEDEQLVPVKLLGETPVGPAEVLLESRTTRQDRPRDGAGKPVSRLPGDGTAEPGRGPGPVSLTCRANPGNAAVSLDRPQAAAWCGSRRPPQ